MCTTSELIDLAFEARLAIQHDCGGYRVVSLEGFYLFPDGGVCPTATRKECAIFIRGYLKHKQQGGK